MLLHFIFLIKEEDQDERKWEFEYIKKMTHFYQVWLQQTFSLNVEVQADEMIVRSGRRFEIVDTPTILEDHRSRGKDIFHFYLTYFRPLWTDCTCEGYFADNFGMVRWDKSPQTDDIKFLKENNCPRVSHELAHEILRQTGYKNYKEIIHEIWDRHIFASRPFEYYDTNFRQVEEKDSLFATLDMSSLRL
jgi:hypothetical protein